LFGINILTDDYFVLSQSTRLTDRRTNRKPIAIARSYKRWKCKIGTRIFDPSHHSFEREQRT